MGWLEGLLTGYTDRRNEIERENMALAEQQAVREGQVYKDLLYSEDPTIKRMAQAGILELGTKRKRSGIAGWLGHMETSPTYQQLLRYGNTPQGHEVYDDDGSPVPPAPQQPSVPKTGGAIATTPPAQGSAAQPTTAATQPGAPPLTPPTPAAGAAPPLANIDPRIIQQGFAGPSAPTASAPGAEAPPLPPELMRQGLTPPPPPPQPGQTTTLAPAQTRKTRTVLEKPNFYPTGAQIKGQQVAEEIEGTVRGYTSMFTGMGQTPEEAHANAVDLYQRTHVRASGANNYQALKGETLGPDGKWTPAYGIKSPTGQVEEVLPDGSRRPFPGGFRPTGPANLMNFGAARNAAMAQLGVSPADMRSDPAKAAEVNALASQLAEDQAYGTTAARNDANAVRGLNTGEQVSTELKMSDDWNQISKKVQDQNSAYAQMQVAYTAARSGGNLKAGAEAMTVLFQKILDPGSVVRETEARRPVEFAGLSGRIEGAWANLKYGGAPITLDDLTKYVALANEMTRAAALGLEDRRLQLAQTATDRGLDPNHVVPPRALMPPLFDPTGGTTTPPPTPPPAAAAPPKGEMSQAPPPFTFGAPGTVTPPVAAAAPAAAPVAAAPGTTTLGSGYSVVGGKYTKRQ